MDRALPPMVEGHLRRTVLSLFAEVVDTHVERHLTDPLTAPEKSAFGVGLVDLIELVLERRLLTLAVSGAAAGGQSARPADCPTQVLPTGMESTIQSQVDEASYQEGDLVYPPLTLGNARNSQVRAEVEDRHGKYNRRDYASKNRDGHEDSNTSETIPVKPGPSPDEAGSAATTSIAKRRTRRKIELKKEPQKPSGRHFE